MRWLVYGDILERHVVDSFVDALRAAGHEVVMVPQIARGLDYRPDPETVQESTRRIDEAMPADVLFNFRAAELIPEQIRSLRHRGVATIVWLPDDPLLWETCYRHIVEAYDLTLHTGREDVLALYEERHDVRGYAFPFWSDDAHYPYVYDLDRADIEVGFLGNTQGTRRRGRYELLASLPFRTRFFGRLAKDAEDYARIRAGQLAHDEIPGALARFRVAISVAQTFDIERGDRFWFPDLAAFRTFFFPSRLIAYAAAGVPSISLEPAGSTSPLRTTVRAETLEDLTAEAAALLGDPAALLERSRATRAEFESCLTGSVRVAMLEQLLAGRRDHDRADRTEMWRGMFRSTSQIGSVERPIQTLSHVSPEPACGTVVIIARDDTGGIVRSARRAGIDVAAFAGAPGILEERWGAPAGWGPVEETPGGAQAFEKLAPDVAVFVDGCAPSIPTLGSLRDTGATVVAFRPSDPTHLDAAAWTADRFDAIVTVDPFAADVLGSTGVRVVRIEPGVGRLEGGSVRRGVVLRAGRRPERAAIRSRLASMVELLDAGASIEAITPDASTPERVALDALCSGALPILHDAAYLPQLPEIPRYHDVAQLLALTSYFWSRPEETAGLVERARARLQAGGLWEHRWRELIAALDPPARPRRPRVALLGYYGRANAGDEMILTSIAEHLPARIDVIAYGPEDVPRSHGLPATSIFDVDAVAEVVAGADALVIGGGGLLQDYALRDGAGPRAGIVMMAEHARRARATGVPVVLFALGVGPLLTDEGRTLARELATEAARVSVRDPASAATLRTCGVERDIVVSADPVWMTSPPDRLAAKSWLSGHGIADHIAVSVRRWADGPVDLPARMAGLLDAVVETGIRVVFVPFQWGTGARADDEAAREVASLMRHGDAAVHLDRPDLLGPVIADARAVVAMRLHASILAAVAGVPSVGIAYDPKVVALYHQLRVSERLIGLDLIPETAVDLVTSLIKQRDVVAERMRIAIAGLRAAAAADFAAMSQVLLVSNG